jgi:transposase
VAHRNARTTVYARRLIVERHRAGWPAARIAEQLGVSCATVRKWIRRHREEGPVGLEDRCSRPHDTPARTPAAVEARVLAMRARLRRGAVYLAGELGLMASTVGRILHRNQVPALTVDPITGLPVRRRHSGIRYERRNPGDLLHVDVKKFGRSPTAEAGDCAGARPPWAQRHKPVRIGYDYLHVAIDGRTRLV